MAETITIIENDKDVMLLLRNPNARDFNEAQKIRNKAFFKSLKEDGLPTVKEIEQVLEERGVWGDKQQKAYDKLRKQVADYEYVLAKGGINIQKAKKIAIKIRILRESIKSLLIERSQYYNNTAEGQADNMHFNYLLSQCLVYNETKEPYYKSLDDYIDKANDLVAMQAATKFADILYRLGDDKSFSEVRFLLDYGFMNEKLQYIDEQNRLVDENGQLIDEWGLLVNEDGKNVDIAGHTRDDEGKPIVKFNPFTNDKGKEVSPNSGQVKKDSASSEPEENKEK